MQFRQDKFRIISRLVARCKTKERSNAMEMASEKPAISEKRTYTVQEVADILGISRNHAYEYIGKIPEIRSVRIGATIRISKKSFDTWLDEQGF